jgi:hypothetical protein
MRLVKLVVAGVVLGAAAGYAAALLRPRPLHRSRAADGPGGGLLDPAPLPEHADRATPPGLMTVPDTAEVRR